MRRLYSTQTLTAVPATIDPMPWGLDLADGSQCVARTGGAWPGGADGTVPDYICRKNDPTPYVLAAPEQQPIDKSNPIWIVRGGNISDNPAALAPPVNVAVRTAYTRLEVRSAMCRRVNPQSGTDRPGTS